MLQLVTNGPVHMQRHQPVRSSLSLPEAGVAAEHSFAAHFSAQVIHYAAGRPSVSHKQTSGRRNACA